MSNMTYRSDAWKTVPQNRSRMIIDIFAILRREVREGRLRVIREDREYNYVKGMKEESGGKKVHQFCEIYVCVCERERERERELCI